MSLGKLKSWVGANFSRKLPEFYLYGDVDNFTFNTTPSQLINYTQSAVLRPGSDSDVDAAAGEITIPSDGGYQITTWLIGKQGNTIKEESMILQLDINSTKFDVSVFDVATDKTDARSFGSTFTRGFSSGDVLSLFCVATADMGTFSVDGVSFEIKRII